MKSQSAVNQEDVYTNIVVATGCPHGGWEILLPTLQQPGLEETGNALSQLYDELFHEAGITDLLQLNQPLQPDCDWAEKATILLSDEPVSPLLWADSRNLWLLDYLAATFPQAKFLLLYTHAESALAYAYRQDVELEQFLDTWQAASRELTRFQRRNRHRSLLVDAEVAAQYPDALADACRHIGLTLRSKVSSTIFPLPATPLERLLFSQFLSECTEVQALQMELEACSQPLGETVLCESPAPTELFQEYLRWQMQIDQLIRARDEQAALATEQQVQLVENRQSQEKLEAAGKEVEQERELLLLRLQQLQKELEAASQENHRIEQLTKVRDEQESLVTEQQVKLTQAQKNQDMLEVINKETEHENELLLLQVHQVQEELEHYYQNNQDAKKDLRLKESLIKELEQQLEESQQTILNKLASPVRAIAKPFKRTGRAREKLIKQARLLKDSGLFDESWYLAEYKYVESAGVDPVEHYLRYGAAEGLNPSPKFDTQYYLDSNLDVAESGLNPLIHFVKFGREEGRTTSMRGSSAWD